MKGFRVERKAGWDTHGLPVEIEVEKTLGIKNKSEIPEYGVDKYNKACRDSVFTYLDLWDEMTGRMGYWIDLKSAYITLKNEYIESVWWALKTLFDKGLIYKDYKIVPQDPKSETVLSSHELALGYRETKDFSWIYGTGLAEPRFSQTLSQIPVGYHLSRIPRGVLGEFSKIEEEFRELEDSIKQRNKVLSICELADLIGAIELFAETYSLSLKDIIKMKDLTKKAFLCGDRE